MSVHPSAPPVLTPTTTLDQSLLWETLLVSYHSKDLEVPDNFSVDSGMSLHPVVPSQTGYESCLSTLFSPRGGVQSPPFFGVPRQGLLSTQIVGPRRVSVPERRVSDGTPVTPKRCLRSLGRIGLSREWRKGRRGVRFGRQGSGVGETTPVGENSGSVCGPLCDVR